LYQLLVVKYHDQSLKSIQSNTQHMKWQWLASYARLMCLLIKLSLSLSLWCVNSSWCISNAAAWVLISRQW